MGAVGFNLRSASWLEVVDRRRDGGWKGEWKAAWARILIALNGNQSDEVAHLQANPNFRCGLDVFEDEPDMKPGLAECPNAVIVPHIASASLWTRGGMATLAATNIAHFLEGHTTNYDSPDMTPFVDGPFADMPKVCPSIVNLDAIKV